MGFPTKNDNFGMFWGYPYLWKHPHPNVSIWLNSEKDEESLECCGDYFIY